MAETQDASVGYMGEFWLHNGSTLYELRNVLEFDVPDEGAREQVDKTTLKSPNWRRQYLSTFYEDSDFEVALQYRPLSDTDVLIQAAIADDGARAFKAVIPENGEPAAQVEGTARAIGRTKPRVVGPDVMQTTVTFRVVTVDAAEAYVE
jgi:hypothetical protein